MTGYYDMASRMIIQLRAIVMAAFQALVPYVSSARLDPAEVRRLYLASYRLLVFLAVAYYTAAAVALPIMLSLWLGRIEPDFIIIALFVLAGWSVNTLVGPAYYVYVATGRLRWTVISHLCIGVGTLVLGLIGGLLFGGFGAVAGVTLALAAGSSVVTVAFHKDFGIGLRELLPRESIAMVGACIGAAAILLVICGAFASDVQAMVAFVVAPLIQGLVVAVVSWRNPNRERLFSMLGQVFSSRAA